jgi:hypothetical protein
MWARISGNQLLEIIRVPKGMKINGVQYPKTIFTDAWTDEERKNIGIVPYKYIGNMVNTMFYKTSEAAPIILEDKVTVVRTTTPIELDTIKVTMKSQINAVLATWFGETDWYFIRKLDTGKEVPADIVKWRNDLRARALVLEAEIDSKGNIAGLEAMTIVTPEMLEDDIEAVAEINDWPVKPR